MKTSVWTFVGPQSKSVRRYFLSIIALGIVFAHVCAGSAVQIVPGADNSYSLDFPVGTYTSQSIAHLNTPDLKKYLFSDQTIAERIRAIGPDTINAIIKQVLNREEKYLKQNYVVFYHAQKLEFMLMQDLIATLVKILHKKASNDYFLLQKFKDVYNQLLEKLHIKSPNNFLFLRAPGTGNQYTNVTQFLIAKTDLYDAEAEIRNVLLSVNPCLFGNISGQDDGLSCTFSFFLQSCNVNTTDLASWIQQIFAHFNLENSYDQHKNQIQRLQELLEQNSPQKTGLLLQFFIPQEYIDHVAYRALPGGMPYHENVATIPQNIRPSKELSDYTKAPFFATAPGLDIDAIQYRLLITNDVLLNPDSKTRIFRYYNRTPNIIKYEQEIKLLFSELAREINN